MATPGHTQGDATPTTTDPDDGFPVEIAAAGSADAEARLRARFTPKAQANLTASMKATRVAVAWAERQSARGRRLWMTPVPLPVLVAQGCAGSAPTSAPVASVAARPRERRDGAARRGGDSGDSADPGEPPPPLARPGHAGPVVLRRARSPPRRASLELHPPETKAGRLREPPRNHRTPQQEENYMSDNHIMTQPEDEVYLALGSYQLPDLGFLIIDKTLVAGSHTEAAELARAWMRETHGEPEELVVYRLDQWTELCALLRALEPTPVPALEPVS